jgi:hypothetical protein
MMTSASTICSSICLWLPSRSWADSTGASAPCVLLGRAFCGCVSCCPRVIELAHQWWLPFLQLLAAPDVQTWHGGSPVMHSKVCPKCFPRCVVHGAKVCPILFKLRFSCCVCYKIQISRPMAQVVRRFDKLPRHWHGGTLAVDHLRRLLEYTHYRASCAYMFCAMLSLRR